MHSKAGTRCWMTPELLAQNHEGHTKATDIYSCGLLFHYVMSGKKHPFNGSGGSITSNYHEIEENIKRNKMFLFSRLSSEAVYLVTEMLSIDRETRPAASSLHNIPYFWDNHRKLEFLKSIGNQNEFQVPRSCRRSFSGVELKLESSWSHQSGVTPWHDKIKLVYNDVIDRKSVV
mgnify:CR=1 FL=1